MLPVPYAFSRLGVLCGLLTQAVVASCNALASVLLLKTASKVGRISYEGTAEAVGGQSWKVVTQVRQPHKGKRTPPGWLSRCADGSILPQ